MSANSYDSIPDLMEYLDENKQRLGDGIYMTLANSLMTLHEQRQSTFEVGIVTMYSTSTKVSGSCCCGEETCGTGDQTNKVTQHHDKFTVILAAKPRPRYQSCWNYYETLRKGLIPVFDEGDREGEPHWEVGDIVTGKEDADGLAISYVVVSVN